MAGQSPAGRSLPSGTLTFLFTDIEGSTRLVQEHGDRWPALLEAHRRLLRSTWKAHRGIELRTEGDSFFVVFERAADAVAAAIAGQRALQAHDWPPDARIRVRMGMHTGEVHVVDGDYAGLAVHLAARVSSVAHGDQVLMTGLTRSIVPDVDAVDLGEHLLKDIDGPVSIFQLLDPALPTTFPVLRTERPPNNLPAPVDEFVGREMEIREISTALDRSRLVTLVGPGGTGKTRLALEVASGRATARVGAVWFIDLSVTSDPDQVDPLVAAVVGVVGHPDRTLREDLIESLRPRRLLLVLDNCEHVIEPAASLVTAVLAAAPAARVLATSRERLGVRGEHTIAIPPLDASADGELAGASDAVRLFVARAQAGSPSFDPSPAELAGVASICRRVDGLPLAIELAASRIRTLSVGQLAARLDVGFRLLASQERGVPSRQQTLEAVVRWSYELLTLEERMLFARVTVFPDSFGLEAVEAVCAGGPVEESDVLDVLTRLVDKSLVTTVLSDEGIRYQVLETLRAFGSARLEEMGDTAPRRDALAAWALRHVETLDAAMRGPGQDEALRRVRPEHANIRAAMEWMREQGDDLAALRTVSAVPVGIAGERLELINELLARTPDVPSAVLGRAMLTSANLHLERGSDQTLDAAREAEVAFEHAGEPEQATWARFFQILPTWSVGDVERVDRLCEELLLEFEAMGSGLGTAYTSWVASLRSEDNARAEELAAAACDSFRDIGADFGLAHALEGRALVLLRAGRADEAVPYVDESLRLFARSGNAGCTAHSLEAVAACLAAVGDVHAMAELSGAAEAFREATGQGHRPWELRGAEEALAALPIGDPDVDAARARGRTHSLTSAVDRALSFLTAVDGVAADRA